MAVPEWAPIVSEITESPQLRIVSGSDRRLGTGLRRMLIKLIKPFVAPIEEYRQFMHDVTEAVPEGQIREARKAMLGDGLVSAAGTVGESLAIAGSVVKLAKIASMATSKDTS